MNYLRKSGKLIITEMDDNPMLWHESDAVTDNLEYYGVHAVQVSTQPLAEIMRRYNPHVAVFRNELRELPAKRNYALERLKALSSSSTLSEAPVTIFFGALNRGKEWQDILPALNEACKRYGKRLRFKVLSDRSFFDALATEEKEFITLPGRDYDGQFVPYEIYQQALHVSDISLLPLHDTEFNRTKSDLKFIESAAHGAVVLASPTVYQESVRDGRTGFLYHDPQEFAQRFRQLVEDTQLRWEMAEEAYRYVRSERLLSQHYLERLEWYRELFERMPELNRDLDARLAKLKRDEKGKG